MTAQFTFDRFSATNLEDPYGLYAETRERAPVWFAAEFGVWIVSRYADVRRALLDTERFSSAFEIRTPRRPAPGVMEILDEGHREVPALLNEDPPDHDRTRNLVARMFGPRRVATLEPRVAEIVTDLIDRLEPRQQGDLKGELAGPLALLVICELIGLPPADAPRIEGWVEEVVALNSFGVDPERQRQAATGSVELERYLAAVVADRRAEPRDDLLSDLIAVRGEGLAPLTDEELISLVISLIFGGHETTANLIGNALLMLLRRPELWDAVHGDPDLVTAAIEETLRADPPAQGMFRRAVTDVPFDDVTIPAGAEVFVLFGSANRDPAAFDEPDEFRPGRDGVERHLGFGRGIHFCPGASLARTEARTAILQLRERLPRLRLQDGFRVPYAANLVHRGPVRLPAVWD